MLKKTIWQDDPEDHDYPAALDYLELLFLREQAEKFVDALQQAPTIKKKSKDILRASRLPLLPKDNIHVQQNLKKIKKQIKLSPILLVRNEAGLIIADGYHRLCCSYYVTEDLEVPCRLV
jgi:hypothetical protein